MDRVEKIFYDHEDKAQGALIVEIPLLLPIPQTQYRMAELLVRAGIDIIQIPIPVRFPWMYGNRILTIQKIAAENDVCFKQSFEVLSSLKTKYPSVEFMPVGFYGGLQRMGQEEYVRRCRELDIRVVDVPDYPLVHDSDPRGFAALLRENEIDYVTIISSEMALSPQGSRGFEMLKSTVERSCGFCFLLAAAGGKTGEKSSFDYDGLARAKERIIEVQRMTGRRCPIVAVCGISTPQQVHILVKQIGVHVMFGSALFTRIMSGESDDEIYAFLSKMKEAAS